MWRYSGIDAFDLDRYAPVGGAGPEAAQPAELALARSLADSVGARSALVVTRDGVVVHVEADPALAGAVTMAAARQGAEPPAELGLLDHVHDAFGELHHAYLADTLSVRVAPKADVRVPVVVVHLVGGTGAAGEPAGDEGAGTSSFPHLCVTVGASADAAVVELTASGDDGRPALVVPVTELEVADDARLSYASVQLLGTATHHVGTQASRVGRDATLRSFTAGFGAAYDRVRTDSDLVGQGGRTVLHAAYLGTGEQVHDFRTLQDHHAPRTSSELLFSGAVADTARSVYSGLIRIRNGARGADAFQTNHNLVLSAGAHADSVPNLDIEENDVRCSHASTVGPVDEEQRYYLESRGIEPSVAERLIVLGFFSAMAERAPIAEVGRLVEARVGERLAGRTGASGG
ncbi:MAG TPA: SufD family Fe-S cluster assembly protein [Acidimicrobiales bacterium]|nr:SufD family Fe-S cluster assembly protein [Acidimicrobiales bacterium]